MYFLNRFLKVWLVALVFSAIGAFAFYQIVIAGHQLRSDVTREQFAATVRTVIMVWVGFITLLSLLLALAGRQESVSLQVYDRNIFLQRIHQALTSLRYRPLTQSDSLLVYKPPLNGGLLAEKITIQLNQDTATITGSSRMLKRIRAMIQA